MPSPGARSPGELEDAVASGTVPVDAVGVTDIESLDGGRISVDGVTTESGVFGFDFQIEVNGVELFDAPVSPDDEGVQTFEPDTDVVAVPGDRSASVSVEITDASTSDGASADVDVSAFVEGE